MGVLTGAVGWRMALEAIAEGGCGNACPDWARDALDRVAGVEPPPLPGDPPAHDIQGGGDRASSVSGDVGPSHRPSEHPPETGDDVLWEAGNLSDVLRPDSNPADAFGRHFFRCFFCHIGDRYVSDYFCETGRELLVAVLDECYERERA